MFLLGCVVSGVDYMSFPCWLNNVPRPYLGWVLVAPLQAHREAMEAEASITSLSLIPKSGSPIHSRVGQWSGLQARCM